MMKFFERKTFLFDIFLGPKMTIEKTVKMKRADI